MKHLQWRLYIIHLRLVPTRDKNSCLVANDTTRKFQNKCGYTTRPEIFNRLSCRIFLVAIATSSCLPVRMCFSATKYTCATRQAIENFFIFLSHFLVAGYCSRINIFKLKRFLGERVNIFTTFVKIKTSYYFAYTDKVLKQIGHGWDLDQVSGLRRCPVYGGRKQMKYIMFSKSSFLVFHPL